MQPLLKKLRGFTISKHRRLSIKKQSSYARRLSFLLGSGVSVVSACSMLCAHDKNKILFDTLVVQKLASGVSLSGITEHTIFFNPISTAFIRLGEETGTLDQSFMHIATELEKRLELQQKIIAVVLYPAVIGLGTISLIIALVVFIFPKIIQIFTGLKVELPLITRIVMHGSLFVQSWWWACLLSGVGGGILCIVVYRRCIKFRHYSQQMILHIPIVHTYITLYYNAYILRLIGTLLEYGVPLTQALIIVGESVTHELYTMMLRECANTLENGGLFSDTIQRYPLLIQSDFIQGIKIGEESGTLGKSILYSAQAIRSEFEYRTKLLTTLIEPILMIGIGGVVAVIAVSIILPMYQITEYLKVR